MLKDLKKDSSEHPLQIMIVTGEASGDEHAARLVDEIHSVLPDCRFFGMGGSNLRSRGVQTIVDSEKVAGVMGITEVRSKLGDLYKAFHSLVREAELRQPSLLILMDFPDFNFLLGKRLRQVIPRTIYFVAPQVWAWRSGRVEKMKRFVDRVAAIFPFEAKFYQERGVDATYVGHPFLAEKGVDNLSKVELGLDVSKPVVAILPGSRRQEIDRLLSVMLDGFEKFRAANPEYQAIIPIAGSLSIADSTRVCEEASKRNVSVVRGQAKAVLAASDIGLIASGTATMEAAASFLPFVSVYRVSPFTHWVAKRLVKGVKYFTMANIIAARKVVPELLQDEVTADAIAKELGSFAVDEIAREQTKKDLREVIAGLDKQEVDCFKRVAEMVYETLEESGQLRKAGS